MPSDPIPTCTARLIQGFICHLGISLQPPVTTRAAQGVWWRVVAVSGNEGKDGPGVTGWGMG